MTRGPPSRAALSVLRSPGHGAAAQLRQADRRRSAGHVALAVPGVQVPVQTVPGCGDDRHHGAARGGDRLPLGRWRGAHLRA